MNRKTLLTIGADPEVFIRSPYLFEGKAIVPAIGRVGGSKEEPVQMEGLPEGFAYQEDNVAAEFCIPPCGDRTSFIAAIDDALQFLDKRVLHDYDIVIQTSHKFAKNLLDNKRAKEFGCDKDFNIWNNDWNKPPCADGTLMRSCGGHIHVGYDNPNRTATTNMVKAMDLLLGVPSVALDPDTERRKLYGTAGSIRPKPYGFEYRTLSNFWIDSDDKIGWVYDMTKEAVENTEKYLAILDKKGVSDRVVDAINNNDVAESEALVKEFNLKVV